MVSGTNREGLGGKGWDGTEKVNPLVGCDLRYRTTKMAIGTQR